MNRNNTEQKSDKVNLHKAISALPQSERSFELFSFSNEYDFAETLEELASTNPTTTEKTTIKVALLVGESNILSILPELAKHADFVICNDINKSIIDHHKFMLDCLNKANTREEFKSLYMDESTNPILTPEMQKIFEDTRKKELLNEAKWEKNEIWNILLNPVSLGEKNFLFSEERFNACKQAAEKLTFAFSGINLFDDKECALLSKNLAEHNAVVALLNLTNLQHYDGKEKLKSTVDILRGNKDNEPIILYSVGPDPANKRRLRSKITDVDSYFKFLTATYKQKWQTEKRPAPIIGGISKLLEDANTIIFTLAKSAGIDNPAFIPKILLKESRSGFSTDVILQKGGNDNANNPQHIESEKLYLSLLKQMMIPWQVEYYLKKGKSDNFIKEFYQLDYKVLQITQVQKFVQQFEKELKEQSAVLKEEKDKSSLSTTATLLKGKTIAISTETEPPKNDNKKAVLDESTKISATKKEEQPDGSPKHTK